MRSMSPAPQLLLCMCEGWRVLAFLSHSQEVTGKIQAIFRSICTADWNAEEGHTSSLHWQQNKVSVVHQQIVDANLIFHLRNSQSTRSGVDRSSLFLSLQVSTMSVRSASVVHKTNGTRYGSSEAVTELQVSLSLSSLHMLSRKYTKSRVNILSLFLVDLHGFLD